MAKKDERNQNDYSRPNCFLQPPTPDRPPHLPHVLATGHLLVVDTPTHPPPRGGTGYSRTSSQGGPTLSTPTQPPCISKWKQDEPAGLTRPQAQINHRVAGPPPVPGVESSTETNRAQPPPRPPSARTRSSLPGLSYFFRNGKKVESPLATYRGVDLSRATTLVNLSKATTLVDLSRTTTLVEISRATTLVGSDAAYPGPMTVEGNLASRLPVRAPVPRETPTSSQERAQRTQQHFIQNYSIEMRQSFANSTAAMDRITPGPRPDEFGGRPASPEYDYPPMPRVECKGLYCGTTDQNVRLWNLRNQARLMREEKKYGKQPEQVLGWDGLTLIVEKEKIHGWVVHTEKESTVENAERLKKLTEEKAKADRLLRLKKTLKEKFEEQRKKQEEERGKKEREREEEERKEKREEKKEWGEEEEEEERTAKIEEFRKMLTELGIGGKKKDLNC
ncbi:hypothetical protein BGX38DRAFT_1140189 [Terfezia claveryi]|nr:hypothetical protein BGX38DRAFT_1140189 [Terfezia claveryi]